jgi:hypothetical protein
MMTPPIRHEPVTVTYEYDTGTVATGRQFNVPGVVQ